VQAAAKPRKYGAIPCRKRETGKTLGWLAVLSDECEPVSARTMTLPLIRRRARATRRERRRGSA
jgi:hypothetical protein